MHYFLYLRRSLTRAWREHLLLLVVMTLAFALPLGMSVLAESCRYGGEQWYIAVTKGGYPVRIANVSAKDAAFFDSKRSLPKTSTSSVTGFILRASMLS